MKYKYLNKILLDWNNSGGIQDNNIIKSSDIKEEIDNCFIYKIDNTIGTDIRIIGSYPIWKKYKDKIYLDGEHIELDNSGWTVNLYVSGKYRVYIEDINSISGDIHNMFRKCEDLISVPLFNTSRVTCMDNMFCGCTCLESVPLFDTSNIISMDNMFLFCPKLNEKTKEEWSSVYDFKKHKMKGIL